MRINENEIKKENTNQISLSYSKECMSCDSSRTMTEGMSLQMIGYLAMIEAMENLNSFLEDVKLK